MSERVSIVLSREKVERPKDAMEKESAADALRASKYSNNMCLINSGTCHGRIIQPTTLAKLRLWPAKSLNSMFSVVYFHQPARNKQQRI